MPLFGSQTYDPNDFMIRRTSSLKWNWWVPPSHRWATTVLEGYFHRNKTPQEQYKRQRHRSSSHGMNYWFRSVKAMIWLCSCLMIWWYRFSLTDDWTLHSVRTSPRRLEGRPVTKWNIHHRKELTTKVPLLVEDIPVVKQKRQDVLHIIHTR